MSVLGWMRLAMNAELSRVTQGLGIASSVEHLTGFLRVPSLLLLCFMVHKAFANTIWALKVVGVHIGWCMEVEVSVLFFFF